MPQQESSEGICVKLDVLNPSCCRPLGPTRNVHWWRRCRRSNRLLAHSLNSLQFALIRAQRSIQILIFAGVIRPAAAIADPILALNHPPEPLGQRASRVSMRRQLRCREVWGRQPRTRAAIDEDGDGAVGEHLQRLAPEHDRRKSAPPMGCHHDHIARLGIGDVDNRFVRMLVLACTTSQLTPAALAASLTFANRCAARVVMRALYDSSVSATVSCSTARTWMGGETVTPVTLALTAFARAVPYWIASSDKSEPSVGMRMCVCITLTLKQV